MNITFRQENENNHTRKNGNPTRSHHTKSNLSRSLQSALHVTSSGAPSQTTRAKNRKKKKMERSGRSSMISFFFSPWCLFEKKANNANTRVLVPFHREVFFWRCTLVENRCDGMIGRGRRRRRRQRLFYCHYTRSFTFFQVLKSLVTTMTL